MAITTNKEISDYIKAYGNSEGLTFTKDVINTLGLDTKRVYLKVMSTKWPCIIYSCSMKSVKILINPKSALLDMIKKSNKAVNVRFCFNVREYDDSIAFFVPGKITGLTNYTQDNKGLAILNIDFTQRPPDDLILLLGKLYDANQGYKNRKEERIPIDDITLKRLNLKSKIIAIKYSDKPEKAVLVDVSFSGAQLIGSCMQDAEQGQQITLLIEDAQSNIPIILQGKVTRCLPFDTPNKLFTMGIIFHEDKIPLDYKVKVNDYFKKKNSYIFHNKR